MDIDCQPSPYLSSLMYVVREGTHAFVVDPFVCKASFLQGLSIDFVLLTHEHFDHISGVTFFQEKYACPVLCAKQCADRLGDPRKNMSAYFDVFTSIPEFEAYSRDAEHVEPFVCKADSTLLEGKPLAWQGHEIALLYTPGHTVGSACYLVDDAFLFTGDTLFADKATETRFPSGRAKALSETAKKLVRLRPEIYAYPGHFERFLLGERSQYLDQLSKGQKYA